MGSRRLRVQARIPFLYAKHLLNEAIKFTLALSENSELAFVEKAFVPVGFQKVFSNRRVFVFSNTLVKVSRCEADIICIAQMLIYDRRLDFFLGLEILFQFLANEYWS